MEMLAEVLMVGGYLALLAAVASVAIWLFVRFTGMKMNRTESGSGIISEMIDTLRAYRCGRLAIILACVGFPLFIIGVIITPEAEDADGPSSWTRNPRGQGGMCEYILNLTDANQAFVAEVEGAFINGFDLDDRKVKGHLSNLGTASDLFTRNVSDQMIDALPNEHQLTVSYLKEAALRLLDALRITDVEEASIAVNKEYKAVVAYLATVHLQGFPNNTLCDFEGLER